MVIGVRTIELHIPGCRSLKEKRFVIKSLRDKIRSRFNISVAEVAYQNLWQRSTLAFVGVNQSGAYINGVLDQLLNVIEKHRRVVIINITTEFL